MQIRKRDFVIGPTTIIALMLLATALDSVLPKPFFEKTGKVIESVWAFVIRQH